VTKRTLAILFAANLMNIFDRLVPAALTEPIRKEFALSDAEIGLLQTGFIVVYAVAGLPLGWLADRWSRRKLLAAGVAVWSGLTAAGGLAGSYAALLISRFGVGIGEAVCAPAASSWIADLVPGERRARAMAIFMFGVPLGGALSYLVAGPVAEAWGWRAALILAAAPSVLLAPALLSLDEPPRRSTSGGFVTLRAVLGIRALWWIILSGALVNFALYALSTFLPAFMMRVHGLGLGAAGVRIGIGYGVAGVAGGAMAALCGDRLAGRHGEGRLLFAAGGALAAAPSALLGIVLPHGSALAALLFLMVAYGLLSGYYALVYASIQQLVPPTVVATTMAVYLLAMYLCGAAFGPLLTGTLSDWLALRAAGGAQLTEAARATGLQQAMLVIPALACLLAASLYLSARAMRREIRPAWPLASAGQINDNRS
jgi:MFS family permease